MTITRYDQEAIGRLILDLKDQMPHKQTASERADFVMANIEKMPLFKDSREDTVAAYIEDLRSRADESPAAKSMLEFYEKHGSFDGIPMDISG